MVCEPLRAARSGELVAPVPKHGGGRCVLSPRRRLSRLLIDPRGKELTHEWCGCDIDNSGR
jgi:hypothetical protein